MRTRVFVGNVSRRVTERELEELFSQVGDVASISIPLDRQTGEARGFAFVEFRTGDSAEEALETLDGSNLDGRNLRLSWAVERERRGGRDASSTSSRRPRDVSRDLDPNDDFEVGGRQQSSGRDDYGEKRRGKPRKRGGHGSDRRRGRGTRRVID